MLCTLVVFTSELRLLGDGSVLAYVKVIGCYDRRSLIALRHYRGLLQRTCRSNGGLLLHYVLLMFIFVICYGAQLHVSGD